MGPVRGFPDFSVFFLAAWQLLEAGWQASWEPLGGSLGRLGGFLGASGGLLGHSAFFWKRRCGRTLRSEVCQAIGNVFPESVRKAFGEHAGESEHEEEEEYEEQS